MTDDALIAALSTYDRPDEALLRAVAAPETVADAILAALAAAADGGPLDVEKESLLLWGVHVLAAARDTRSCAALLRLLRRPDEEIDLLLGDAIPITLPSVVISVFDGNPGPLLDLVADIEANPLVRGSLLQALAYLAWEGRIDRDAAVRLLERIDDERLAAPDSRFWNDWQFAISLLGVRALAPRVEAAFADGRIATEIDTMADFLLRLETVERAPDSAERFEIEGIGYVDNVLDTLDLLDGGEDALEAPEGLVHDPLESGPMQNPFRNVGRNDPCPCGSGKKFKKCCMTAA
ncbi:MAG: DUF1186 domain-containing protein [Rhodospirillales bacterium]